MKVSLALFANGRTDSDAQLTLAVKSEIAQGPCVRTAADGFQFIDDLHRPELRRAGNAAARKTGSQCGEMAHLGSQPALDGGDQVLHLWIALESHQFRNLNGTEFTDFAQIVSQQIRNH